MMDAAACVTVHLNAGEGKRANFVCGLLAIAAISEDGGGRLARRRPKHIIQQIFFRRQWCLSEYPAAPQSSKNLW